MVRSPLSLPLFLPVVAAEICIALVRRCSPKRDLQPRLAPGVHFYIVRVCPLQDQRAFNELVTERFYPRVTLLGINEITAVEVRPFALAEVAHSQIYVPSTYEWGNVGGGT